MEALAKPCSGGLRPPKLPAKRESAVGDRRYRTGFCKRLAYKGRAFCPYQLR
jgi:hypothetical protein